MPRRYRIYLLSAKSILSYAKEEGGAVSIALNRDATRRCVVSDRQEQEGLAHNGGTDSPNLVEGLSSDSAQVSEQISHSGRSTSFGKNHLSEISRRLKLPTGEQPAEDTDTAAQEQKADRQQKQRLAHDSVANLCNLGKARSSNLAQRSKQRRHSSPSFPKDLWLRGWDSNPRSQG